MNATDATLWEIARDPELRTTIVALALLDGTPEPDAFDEAIERAVERLPRFRQRVVEGPGGLGRPRWADTDVDISAHVHRRRLGTDEGLDEVLRLCGELSSQDFDHDRPLWQIHLLDGLPGGSAMVVKISHALTDGVGGMGLLRSFAEGATKRSRHRDETTHQNSIIRSTFDTSRSLASTASAAARWAADASVHPQRSTREATSLVGSAARMVSPSGPPFSTALAGRSLDRWAGISEIPLERMRRAAHRADGTINDAFTTIAIAALADYERQCADGNRGEPLRFRVTLPVNLRASGASSPETLGDQAGNDWTPARLVLESQPDAHPFAELRRHRHVLHAAIHEPAIAFGQTIAAALLELPSTVTTSVVGGIVKGSDLVLSDVPGLREPLEIAGCEVRRFHPFAPTGGAAVNVALVSHLDTACVGFTVDRAAIAEPEQLVDLFAQHTADFLRRRQAPAEAAVVEEPTLDAGTESGATELPTMERLSALDTSFLRMETATTPMHLGGLFIVEQASSLFTETDDRVRTLDIDLLRQHVLARLPRVSRLRRRVSEIPFGIARPVWVDTPDFDITDHVHHRRLPAPGSRRQLVALCEAVQMERLDRDRPLFDLTFVDGLDPAVFGDDAIAVIDRVHHALLDGLSGLEMLSILFDADPSTVTALDAVVPAGGSPTREPSAGRLLADAVSDQAQEPMALLATALRAARSPLVTATHLVEVAATVGDLVGSAVSRSESLNHPVSSHRRLRSIRLDLDDLRRTSHMAGASINDLVLTAVTFGARALFEQRDAPVPDPFTALVPVSTRHGDMDEERGNHVSAFVVELPMSEHDPHRALVAVRDRMADLKSHHHEEGAEILLQMSDHLPPGAIDVAARWIERQRSVNMVVTNLPGPPDPLHLRGHRVREMIPIVPLGGNLTISVAVISYAGELIMAFHADEDDCPDLDVMAAACIAAFDELSRKPVASEG